MGVRHIRQVALSATVSMCALSACSKKDAAPADSSKAMMPADSMSAMKAPKTMAAPDSDMQAVLNQLAELHGKPIETLTPKEARMQPTPTDAVKALLVKMGKPTTPPPGATLTNRMVGGAAGQLPANIYTPDGAGPFPIVVYFHGGGWVIASKDVYDAGARSLAINAKAVVVSADYRLSPEAKFPAAHDDAIAVYDWAVKNAASIKGDAKRVALAGESAGGNLAMATAIAARDKGMQAPVAVIAVYPVAQNDTTTPAYAENANAKPLNRPMIGWFLDKLLKTPADAQDTRLNLVAANLKGLPPVTIINAQIDPLRGDGEMLADKIRAAGGTVSQKTYDGVTHEFFGMSAVLPKAKDAQMMAADALKKAFGM